MEKKTREGRIRSTRKEVMELTNLRRIILEVGNYEFIFSQISGILDK